MGREGCSSSLVGFVHVGTLSEMFNLRLDLNLDFVKFLWVKGRAHSGTARPYLGLGMVIAGLADPQGHFRNEPLEPRKESERPLRCATQ